MRQALLYDAGQVAPVEDFQHTCGYSGGGGSSSSDDGHLEILSNYLIYEMQTRDKNIVLQSLNVNGFRKNIFTVQTI